MTLCSHRKNTHAQGLYAGIQALLRPKKTLSSRTRGVLHPTPAPALQQGLILLGCLHVHQGQREARSVMRSSCLSSTCRPGVQYQSAETTVYSELRYTEHTSVRGGEQVRAEVSAAPCTHTVLLLLLLSGAQLEKPNFIGNQGITRFGEFLLAELQKGAALRCSDNSPQRKDKGGCHDSCPVWGDMALRINLRV
jgi:hypothetical protein